MEKVIITFIFTFRKQTNIISVQQDARKEKANKGGIKSVTNYNRPSSPVTDDVNYSNKCGKCLPICHHFRDIRCQNVYDLELDLSIESRSNINMLIMPIEKAICDLIFVGNCKFCHSPSPF